MTPRLQLQGQDNRIALVNATAIGQNKSNYEELFFDTCIDELVTSNIDSIDGSDDDLVSQTKFATFVIQYCRDNEYFRGPECSNALFFFKDLPNEIQLEFLRHSVDVCLSGSVDVDDSVLQDCLDVLNAEGGLFFVDANKTSVLCTATFDLMIHTNLLLNSTAFPDTAVPMSTSQPIAPVAPTLAPLNDLQLQQPTVDQNRDQESTTGLSSVGILGIVMTVFFVMLFLTQCIVLHRRKRNSKKSQSANDVIALREDESVVASEHSHELLSPIADVGVSSVSHNNRENSMLETSLTPTDAVVLQPVKSSDCRLIRAKPKSAERQKQSTKSWRLRHFSFENTDKSHSDDATHKHLHPHPLITENLSDGNPVHVRKRFHKKSAGSFPFDSDDINRVGDIFNNDVCNKMTPAILQIGKENDVATSRNVQVQSTNASAMHHSTAMTTEIEQGLPGRSSQSALFRQRA